MQFSLTFTRLRQSWPLTPVLERSALRPAPLLCCLWLLAAVMLTVGLQAQPAVAADGPPVFERDVRPIFKAWCLDCHGSGEELSGGLDLRLRRFAVSGGDSGPAIVPGSPEESLLLARLRAGEMPPTKKKVPPEQIAVIEAWIAHQAPTLRDEPESLPPGIDITPEERAFWAFQPIRRPEMPQLENTVPAPAPSSGPPVPGQPDVVRTPIDAFILARLRAEGLSMAPEADRLSLLRRASFDLLGLPPTPEEIEAFLHDPAPDAYEAMLDRLLASPHYGERWARHWLDVAGYADSEGNGSEDTPRPYAYKYRDYVIRALNADRPLDRFITEQLAGDELVPQPWSNLTPEQVDILAATGFLRMVPDGTAGGRVDEAAAQQVVADAIKVLSSALLGLTVGCAQCHDHRYDPVPQVDYYRLRAAFEPAFDPSHWRLPSQRLLSLYTDADRQQAALVAEAVAALQAEYNAKQARLVAEALEKELEKYPEPQRGELRQALQTPAEQRSEQQRALLAAHPNLNITPGVLYQYNQAAADELKADMARIAAKAAERPVEDFVSLLCEQPGVRPATHVFYRGDHRLRRQQVQAGDLTICAPEGARFEIPDAPMAAASSGRRLALARHWTSGRHPLVGRVLANRIWMHHFGRGIVDTPGDFGMLGSRPSHPELLDWLADELVRQGWSLKRMHKLIMCSAVYRQSSVPRTASHDTRNRLLGRFPIRRLEAEVLRDRILEAAGRLDRTMYGPPVPVELDAVGQVIVKDDLPRRSIYLEVRRSQPVSLLAVFDQPSDVLHCECRVPSTTASQALVLMNNDFVLKHARLFAERVYSQPDRSARIRHAWQIAYQRPPAEDELNLATEFLNRQEAMLQASGHAEPELAALTNLCQQLFASHEFLYVD